LRHPEAFGGASEVQLFGDGDEIAQLPEVWRSHIENISDSTERHILHITCVLPMLKQI
jgi:hypothetical protein